MADASLAACYATLILQEGGSIDGDKIVAVCKAAGITVDKNLAKNFAKFAAASDLKKTLGNISFGGGAAAAPAGGSAPAAAAAPAAEKGGKKVEEKKEESDDEMGFGLFD